ncbi:MAG: class I SAM-dependent methyltransferase [Acidimicrobiaceae bacterium]|nr:class I SAM-dependent methyltransferase [Acidimicrobiaceae bacterium]MXW74666.1 class I SAM-dependent methyltransferase [Acidimicrobiaceae bacterium]MYA75415.1 class I SAM-dependent methyltransferase [Acidimicrobiaceae bacterium]MYC41361.1 class I SAM-dependent methyltransferase [Acidimicrobiaceae bacterium]MYD05372.1 class I SAM-dependent methyltransferase [Acidimicrobiaceae bacterium]
MEAAGESIHGEADLVSLLLESYGRMPGASVLDAGCGTGRVAVELHRRGFSVVGVDLDAGMLSEARSKAPELCWLQDDLCAVNLDCQFPLIVMAGNVMIFVEPGTEGTVLANMARHLEPGGLLLAGFQLCQGHLSLGDYDRHCTAAGLTLEERWATWSQDAFRNGNYAVSLHRLGSTR